MEVYHSSASTNDTFNPYLPAIGRVLQVLHALAPIGTTIEVNNRDLASAAGLRSAGHIPRLLRKLESEGHIERVTSPQGTLIMVVDAAPLIPHAGSIFSALGSDPEWDQPEIGDPTRDQQNPMETRDQSEIRTDERSRMSDPPCTPNMVLSMSSQQQQLVRGREALYNAILAVNGQNQAVALEILGKNPLLDLAAFQQLCRAGAARGSRVSKNSIGLVLWCLQTGQTLHTPKESSDAPAKRRQPAQNQPQRPGRDHRNAAPPLTRAALQARGRRGDRMPDLSGGGPAAGG